MKYIVWVLALVGAIYLGGLAFDRLAFSSEELKCVKVYQELNIPKDCRYEDL